MVLIQDSFFKVLDVYKVSDKTQVSLLHIPEAAVDFFAGTFSNVEKELIRIIREDFDTKIKMAPVPELQDQEWKKRTGFPIGMDDNGALFFNKQKAGEMITLDKLPEATALKTLPQTEFALTLETPLSAGRNAVYASSFLYAWDKVKEIIKAPVRTDESNSADFIHVTRSISYRHSLTPAEYTVDTRISKSEVQVKSSFSKILPFKTGLQEALHPVSFDGKQVAAFGMYHFDEKITDQIRILHYRDSDQFMLRLSPWDVQHEIMLVKGIGDFRCLADAVSIMNALIPKGAQERKSPRDTWKYRINENDTVSIPSLRFNIETNYDSIERQRFMAGDVPCFITEAYQRTGFSLDQKGAAAESESRIVMAMAMPPGGGERKEVPPPKQMIFDKPFVIVLKRTDSSNPYLVVKVTNAELLVHQV